MGILAVLWEKWTEFKRDFYKITVAALVSPLLYLIVFGFGIQTTSHGEPYLNFLIPGIVSMATMTGSFSAVAQNMSVQRLYEKALDQVMISPTPLWQFIVGQIIGGSLRGLYAGCMILLLTFPIRTGLVFNGLSILIMFLNGMVFSTFALVLCNTFFSIDQMPGGFRQFINALPLSQTSGMIRAISANGSLDGLFVTGEYPYGWAGLLILLAYLVVFSLLSFVFIYKKKNL